MIISTLIASTTFLVTILTQWSTYGPVISSIFGGAWFLNVDRSGALDRGTLAHFR